VALRDLFGGKRSSHQHELTIDDLITLERYEEAEQKLRSKLSFDPRDLHSRLKLADVLMQVGQRVQAVDEYLVVAESYGRDGFYDKASALLAKIGRYLPGNEKIRAKLSSLERAKSQERRRELVVEGLLHGQRGAEVGGGLSAVGLQQLWHNLAESVFLERLSDGQVRRLFGAVRLRQLNPGERLVEAGSPLEEIFVIGRGEVEAVAVVEGDRRTALRTFGPGDVIGDRALLEHQPWPADYEASQESVVLALDKSGLEQAMTGESDPKGFLDLLRQRHDQGVFESMRRMGLAS
jgi:Cyclic nucleotide-binding domain